MQLSTAALDESPLWAAYKASLTRNGYFRGNIPGSAQYKQLLAEAQQSFAQNEAFQQAAEAAAAPAEAITALLQQPADLDSFQVLHCLHAGLDTCQRTPCCVGSHQQPCSCNEICMAGNHKDCSLDASCRAGNPTGAALRAEASAQGLCL